MGKKQKQKGKKKTQKRGAGGRLGSDSILSFDQKNACFSKNLNFFWHVSDS
jgi:hypothetical protein